MRHVLAATRAVLLQFHAALRVLAVLLSRVGPLFALVTGQRDYNSICFLSWSHTKPSM